jgi:hypothetical protein
MDNNYYQVANFPVPGTVAVVMFLSIYRVQIRQLELLRILGYNNNCAIYPVIPFFITR